MGNCFRLSGETEQVQVLVYYPSDACVLLRIKLQRYRVDDSGLTPKTSVASYVKR
jgi:hypothetical protein